jgi:hypothetical protein
LKGKNAWNIQEGVGFRRHVLNRGARILNAICPITMYIFEGGNSNCHILPHGGSKKLAKKSITYFVKDLFLIVQHI